MDTIYLLTGLNQLLSSAITILTFSLLAYIVTFNLRSSLGRAFAVLLACVCFTYAGDVAIFRIKSLPDAIPWLKFQWIGIAFTPAVYLHFADVLLRTTNAHSSRRRIAVFTAYFFGFILLMLAIETPYLVRAPFHLDGATQFTAGPFFSIFTVYFYTTVFWGTYKVYVARTRCLTSGARRRMTYLAISFIAPALGIYPYMLIASIPSLEPTLLLSILFVGNIGISIMIMVMAYSVASFGALTPDRVVKHDLVHFLLRGPLAAILVIILIQALPKYPTLLSLPRDFVLATLIVAVIVLSQLFINLVKHIIDGLIFHQDRQEVMWISELDRRLLTTTDLQQALENILITLCELVRVQTGFIYNLNARQGPRLEAQVGSPTIAETALAAIDVPALVEQRNGRDGYHFIVQNNFWFIILQNKARDHSLGLLGIEARAPDNNLTPLELEGAARLLFQAELALEDRLLQQEVFTALKIIIPEIERVQRLRSAVPYTDSPSLINDAENPIHQQDFPDMVRDALKHYWGGPKLTSSPLLTMRVVQENLDTNAGNPVQSLRSVLNKAIEQQRPEGERHMKTSDWLIYNILDLKFIQGLRVRDVADRLAMSESDLYRKQRLAIEEVARTLKEMEVNGAK